MTKVEEKLKAGRAKRPEGSGFSEESQRRPATTSNHPSKKDPATSSSGECMENNKIKTKASLKVMTALLRHCCLEICQANHCFPMFLTKVLFPTPSGSEPSRSAVKWFVPPVLLSRGKQSTA